MTNAGPAYDAECVFCRIVAGEIPATVVRDGADFLAFRDIAPQAPTHIVIVPKKHGYRDVAALTDADPALAGALLAEGVAVARQEHLDDHGDVPGYRLVLNTGDAAGQTVYHVHLHVLGADALGHFGSAPHS